MRRIAAACAACALIGVLASGAAASAAPVEEVVQGRYLRIVSVADWGQASRMMPGQSLRWDIEISADAPEHGSIAVELEAFGDAELVVDAESCAEAWRGDECQAGADRLRTEWSIPRDGEPVALLTRAASEVVHLRLTVRMGEAAAGETTALSVHATGAGERVDASPDGALALTGVDGTAGTMVVAGAALLAGGAVLTWMHSRRRAREGS